MTFTGENSIVIVLGANESLSPEQVDSAVGVIRSASVLLCQLETPLETTLHALKLHQSHGSFFPSFLFTSRVYDKNDNISQNQTIVKNGFLDTILSHCVKLFYFLIFISLFLFSYLYPNTCVSFKCKTTSASRKRKDRRIL